LVAKKFDAISFELFKNAVFSITDEMALTVFRTTYSGVLKDNMDYSTGFADADGKLAAQGLTFPSHLGSVPTAMESITRHFHDDIAPGDVFIMKRSLPWKMGLKIKMSGKCMPPSNGS
jgi:N-methylhydantoinase B